MEDSVASVNMLAQQLADVNGRILATGQSGQSPNSIFDLRDRIITDLSNMVDLTVEYQDRGVTNIRLGASGVGPILVDQKIRVPSVLMKRSAACSLLFCQGQPARHKSDYLGHGGRVD